MGIAHFLRLRTFFGVAIVLVLATAAYGFAAANTVSSSGAGDGNGAISGYTIDSIGYTLNAADPSKLDTVRFAVTPSGTNPQPATVKVQVVTGGAWYSAAHGTGTSWSVDLAAGNVSVLSVNNLRVVAAQ